MRQESTRVVIGGQSLIKRDIQGTSHPGFRRIIELVRQGDHAFTNLEVTIAGSRGGEPTKEKFLTTAAPEVLDSLKEVGFDTLSLSNNHMFDLGPDGVQSTLEEVAKRGFAFAGAGLDLSTAAAPGFHRSSASTLGVLAMDCGPQPADVYAKNESATGSAQPGINGLRINESEHGLEPESEDVEAVVRSIRTAGQEADLVLVYVHNHHWEEVKWKTPRWMVDFAHRCIDAGAHMFVGHGAPALHAIEIYKGQPIFYGLGNFLFQTSLAKHWKDEFGLRPWQSVVAEAEWTGGKLAGLKLTPICLGHEDEDSSEAKTANFLDFPLIPLHGYGRRILDSLDNLSQPFGTRLRHVDGAAIVELE
ncbi:MAG: CapA family protein [Trueperaceae bacterium]